jgi:ubiquitin carboxyl-terminal hydrolase 34
MASANTDAWDRDHAADANPDLTRKRPRLSEELQPSPSPSSAADDHAVILQVQDDTMAMPRLSDHFLLDSSIHVSATQQLQGLLKQVHGNDYMSLSWFEYLSAWMYQHVNDLTDQDRLRDAYFDDLDFFAHLGLLCYAIMERQDDLFEDVHLSPREVAHITQSVENFCHAAMVLAVRMLSYLPSLVDTAVSRRDSAQTSNTRHNIDLLYWVQVLAQVASLHNAPQLTKYFYLQLDYKPKRAAGTFRRDLVDTQQPLDYLLQLLEKLSDNHRQIVNSWIALDAIIHILNSLNLGARKETELVLETIHMYLLPTACEKHPRSLPENFHDLLVETAGNAIEHLSQNAGDTAIASLYDRYIKDELDGLLPTSGSDSQVCQRLQQISAGDPDVRTELMLTAWILQAFRSFIYSDIMDVRNCGIALLSKRLVTLHKKHNPHNDCPDHPVLQYVARFLRTNELPKYIFGPNSHSSIVHHSQHIISFLAVNAAYTNLETDIIWHACAYSVEAEFVKSSFAVLNEVVNFLNLEQLLYLANKYAITPPTKLGKHAVDFLTRIFQRIQVKSDEGSERHERLATAFICIDIMMQVGQTEENLLLNKLRETARNELFRFANPSFSPEDRVQICSRCLPNIIDHSEHATVSVDILVMFLRNLVSIQEAQQLLSLLSVSSVIDGLVRYVNDRHAAGRTIGLADLCGIDVRIESILHLMALSGTQPDEDDVRKFYQHTVGELALGNEARDRAWMLLTHMGNIQNLSLVASTLLQRFLAQDTINLAVCFMTPQLLGLFAEQLKAQAASEFEFSTILDTPIWKKLLETAEHESITPATQQAARIIIHLLFEYGQRTHSAEVISRCHASFAKQQIRRICDNFASLPHLVSSRERIVAIDREISLLDAVMAQSKATPVASSGEVDRELRLVDSGVEKPTHFKLQVYGAGQSPPAVYLVVASESTLLSELTTRLPDITGASQIRVIIGGKPVDLASNATESISRLGLDKSGVIHVCPKYSPQSDLAKVLKPPGVIEQEIGEHYTELDGLLDGPDAISQKVRGCV